MDYLLGYLDDKGKFSTIKSLWTSQGYSYSMPYYGDSVMVYDFTTKTVVPTAVIGTGCLLALLGIR